MSLNFDEEALATDPNKNDKESATIIFSFNWAAVLSDEWLCNFRTFVNG